MLNTNLDWGELKMRMRDDIVECYDLVVSLNNKLKNIKTFKEFEELKDVVSNTSDTFELGFYSKRRLFAEVFGFTEQSCNRVRYLYDDGANSGGCAIENLYKYLEIKSNELKYRLDGNGNFSKQETQLIKDGYYGVLNEHNKNQSQEYQGKKTVIKYSCPYCGEQNEFKGIVYENCIDRCIQCHGIVDLVLHIKQKTSIQMLAYPRYRECVECGKIFIAESLHGDKCEQDTCVHCNCLAKHKILSNEDGDELMKKRSYLREQHLKIGMNTYKNRWCNNEDK